MEWRLHWENLISISFQIEWDIIVVTVFLSILNQMEIHLVQNCKENCHHNHIPLNLKGNWNQVFSVCFAGAGKATSAGRETDVSRHHGTPWSTPQALQYYGIEGFKGSRKLGSHYVDRREFFGLTRYIFFQSPVFIVSDFCYTITIIGLINISRSLSDISNYSVWKLKSIANQMNITPVLVSDSKIWCV